jgi:hypothetical protein
LSSVYIAFTCSIKYDIACSEVPDLYIILLKKRWLDINYRLPAGEGLVHTHDRVRVMFIIADPSLTAKAALAAQKSPLI